MSGTVSQVLRLADAAFLTILSTAARPGFA